MSAGRGNSTRSTAQRGIISTKVAGCAIRDTSTITPHSGLARAATRAVIHSGLRIRSGNATACLVTEPLPCDLLPELIANYEDWEKSNRDANGLYWQIDDRDGMEVSIGGSGYRATLNSYQFGDALAIARIAELAGKTDIASDFRQKAAAIKKLVQEQLWDADAQFFKVLPRGENKSLRKCARTARFHALVFQSARSRNSPWRGNRPWIREVSSRRSG